MAKRKRKENMFVVFKDEGINKMEIPLLNFSGSIEDGNQIIMNQHPNDKFVILNFGLKGLMD